MRVAGLTYENNIKTKALPLGKKQQTQKVLVGCIIEGSDKKQRHEKT